jgi:DNA helicase HerA-like ATPase
MNKLSKQAKEEYEKLEKGLQAIINRDRVREPKLTESEKVRIADLTDQVKEYEPILPRLENELAEKNVRLKELTMNAAHMVVGGADAIAIAQEYLVIRQAYLLLEEAHRLASAEYNGAKIEIEKIKQDARKRELAEEGTVMV